MKLAAFNQSGKRTIGAVVGGFIFDQLVGFDYRFHGFIASTFVAVIGAIIVLAIWNAATGNKPLR